jgi:hypothetical protein
MIFHFFVINRHFPLWEGIRFFIIRFYYTQKNCIRKALTIFVKQYNFASEAALPATSLVAHAGLVFHATAIHTKKIHQEQGIMTFSRKDNFPRQQTVFPSGQKT